jgi:hypothetical protein
MLDSFIRHGIPQGNIHIVCCKGLDYYAGWERLATKYSDVKFFFYEDSRVTKKYVSSIRPNILKQHFSENPYLKEETIFYHDCDIILTKEIMWDKFLKDDVWYGSDCCDYLGYYHILNKGEDILNRMCEISSIDPEIVKSNENNSIGAQYILKGIDDKFWEDVEIDSERMFSEITDMINEKKQKEPLVIYCSDMWALLWNGWKRGKQTICHEDLSFCWAPREKESFEKHSIFHNAGVAHNMQGEYFYKYLYLNSLPYKDELGIKKETASYLYWMEIKKTGENTVLY